MCHFLGQVLGCAYTICSYGQISQWITLPTQSCLVLYSFCANLLHSLIMWLIVSSLPPYSLHLLFCCVLSILALVWLVLMVLFSAAIRRDSVFRNHRYNWISMKNKLQECIHISTWYNEHINLGGYFNVSIKFTIFNFFFKFRCYGNEIFLHFYRPTIMPDIWMLSW